MLLVVARVAAGLLIPQCQQILIGLASAAALLLLSVKQRLMQAVHDGHHHSLHVAGECCWLVSILSSACLLSEMHQRYDTARGYMLTTAVMISDSLTLNTNTSSISGSAAGIGGSHADQSQIPTPALSGLSPSHLHLSLTATSILQLLLRTNTSEDFEVKLGLVIKVW